MSKVIFEETELAKKIANYRLPRFEDLPSITLVMRQLVQVVDECLSIFKLPSEEKFITSSMINSYVHQKVIRAPENKEYDKRQMIHLIAIGILKQVLSISDVAKLIKLQTEQYPIDIAYNYFCDELENALKITFGSRDFSNMSENKAKEITPLSETMRSAVFAFANAIYTKHNLNYILKK